GALFGRILDRNLADDQIAADPFTKERPVFFQIVENPGADRSEPGQTDTDVADHCSPASCLHRGIIAMFW
ncbi:MAG: hypothetical protein ACKOKC_10325, partial [Chthoniobacterales bacterium]